MRNPGGAALFAWLMLLCACVAPGAEVPSSGGLLQNPGFESEGPTPGQLDPWFFFASRAISGAVETNVMRSGARCVRLEAQALTNAHLGIAQVCAVEPGQTYEFSAFVRNHDNALNAGAEACLGIEWKDAANREVGRKEGKPWGKELSRLRWEWQSVSDTAPQDAVSGTFVIHLREGQRAGTGAFFVDDVNVIAR